MFGTIYHLRSGHILPLIYRTLKRISFSQKATIKYLHSFTAFRRYRELIKISGFSKRKLIKTDRLCKFIEISPWVFSTLSALHLRTDFQITNVNTNFRFPTTLQATLRIFLQRVWILNSTLWKPHQEVVGIFF